MAVPDWQPSGGLQHRPGGSGPWPGPVQPPHGRGAGDHHHPPLPHPHGVFCFLSFPFLLITKRGLDLDL